MKRIEDILNNRNIIVCLNNPRNYFMVASFLKEMGIHFKSIDIIDINDLFNADIVICEPQIDEFRKYLDKIVVVKKGISKIYFSINLGRAALGKDKISELIVGVDPGKNTGFIILLENIIIYSEIIRDKNTFLQRIREILECRNISRIILKVGSHIDDKTFRELLDTIGSEKSRIDIEIVDEDNLMFSGRLFKKLLKNKDLLAALTIALS